ncbi:hypothetical protein GDO81_011028 [Engystomops pustulosus]|uniref:Uncharacterized protein n=1 Tax=Engystomops pustulosus TaxID=76066 RepID=A0AAV7C4Y2_ENGPU|nr:hypothetical protein GDO81_011028 [Engystomops pustulosus]
MVSVDVSLLTLPIGLKYIEVCRDIIEMRRTVDSLARNIKLFHQPLRSRLHIVLSWTSRPQTHQMFLCYSMVQSSPAEMYYKTICLNGQ